MRNRDDINRRETHDQKADTVVINLMVLIFRTQQHGSLNAGHVCKGSHFRPNQTIDHSLRHEIDLQSTHHYNATDPTLTWTLLPRKYLIRSLVS